MLWGTSYLVTTELLPAHRPLLAAAARALPAGVLLLALVALLARRWPRPTGAWWWRSAVLGALNIGAFFALLFVAAYRLPGGVAAVLGAVAPFVVAGFAFTLLGQRSSRRVLVAAAIGVGGLAVLVLRSTVHLDPIGLAAAAGGVLTMSLGTVLGRRWGTPAGYPNPTTAVLALTGWQLVAGGLMLAPAALLVEGPPPALTAGNLVGFGYLAIVGTAIAHSLWFRGVAGIAPAKVTMLALLSPVVATGLGWIVLGQSLSLGQLIGAAVVLAAIVLGVSEPSRLASVTSPPARSPLEDRVPPAGVGAAERVPAAPHSARLRLRRSRTPQLGRTPRREGRPPSRSAASR
jgi:probable blue pigment (indigoidine) exporter